ncbi:MAG: energy transducer TonB [Flavobacteriaceae bacterium]|nr:energy transducer TonB [Flavobacteriaceae bacterium]
MQIKKNPKANLEKYSKLFFMLGLVLALVIVYVAIEKKTYDRVIADLGPSTYNIEDEEQTVEIEKIKPPKPKTPPPPKVTQIEVVEDEKEVVETVIESTETEVEEAVEVEEVQEVEEEEEVIEDVAFAVIEDVPVFPGCTGSKAELKKCLEQKVKKHVNRKFNTELASELGLSPGVKRIAVMFKIDKTGNITNIQVRAPHKRLKQEAIRVIKSLPKMKPGRQRGKPVGVKYALPIAFKVEG